MIVSGRSRREVGEGKNNDNERTKSGKLGQKKIEGREQKSTKQRGNE